MLITFLFLGILSGPDGLEVDLEASGMPPHVSGGVLLDLVLEAAQEGLISLPVVATAARRSLRAQTGVSGMLDAADGPHVDADDLRDVLLRDLGIHEIKNPLAFCLLLAHLSTYKNDQYTKLKLFERTLNFVVIQCLH